MAHFAKVVNGIVEEVIVAEQDYIDSLSDSSTWIQTSYNTRGGVHYGADGNPDGGVALRKNYAGVGYSYDSTMDAFIPPKPSPSWVLDTNTCYWLPPIPYPDDGAVYLWNENTEEWVALD